MSPRKREEPPVLGVRAGQPLHCPEHSVVPARPCARGKAATPESSMIGSIHGHRGRGKGKTGEPTACLLWWKCPEPNSGQVRKISSWIAHSKEKGRPHLFKVEPSGKTAQEGCSSENAARAVRRADGDPLYSMYCQERGREGPGMAVGHCTFSTDQNLDRLGRADVAGPWKQYPWGPWYPWYM